MFLFLLCLVWYAAAALVNVTVDDSHQSIVYSPPDTWSAFDFSSAPGPGQPDLSLTFQNTFHQGVSGSAIPSLSFNFNGTALYVYCVVPHGFTSASNSDMTFYIDSERVGTFNLAPNGSDVFSYDTPVYHNRSIPSGNHTFRLDNGHLNGQASVVIFDYLTYTSDDGSSPPPSDSLPTKSLAIAIGTAASVLVVIALALFFILKRRRKDHSSSLTSPITTIQAYPSAFQPNRAEWKHGRLVPVIEPYNTPLPYHASAIQTPASPRTPGSSSRFRSSFRLVPLRRPHSSNALPVTLPEPSPIHSVIDIRPTSDIRDQSDNPPSYHR